jgi:hypothetical protein
MQRWEYLWRRVMWNSGGVFQGAHYELKLDKKVLKDKDVWTHLDELGSKGWELVSTTPELGGSHGATNTAGYMLWFKRPIE